MKTSRISTPVNVKIDEWLFHFNGKSVKVTVHLRRPRDPEAVVSGGSMVKIASFHAYFERKHLKNQGLENAGFALTPISGYDYDELFRRVRDTIQSAKSLVWEKIIVIATKGADDNRDGERIKFDWAVGLRSKDGVLFKKTEGTNYVTKRVTELLGRSFLFDNADTAVYPYDPVMEASLIELDAMFERFSGALKVVINRPDVILNIRNRLLPLTTEEIPAEVKPV